MKLVINRCYGGFSLSPEATLEVYRRGGKVEATPVGEYFTRDEDENHPYWGRLTVLNQWREYLKTGRSRMGLTVFSDDESKVLDQRPKDRACPVLVAVVGEMGKRANGGCAALEIVDIPDGVEWEIDEYDGMESVHEVHRSWP